MLDFMFQWPTKLIFGKDSRLKIGEALDGTASKVLLVCAKGPFRENGRFNEIKQSLTAQGIEVFEMGDIDQNPRLSSVREGVSICKEQRIDCVVALGGGSAMDCTKLIAGAALYNDDPYEFIWGSRKPIERSLKTVMLPTIAATGTETNPSAVIVNDDTKEKFYCDCKHPYLTIFDPVLTASAPYRLVVWGAMDILSHTFEFYFNGYEGAEFQSRLSEAIILSVMEALNHLHENPKDLTSLGELQWCAAMAWGGLAGIGRLPPEMTCHWIEESFSGYFDTHHGACLGVLTPRWMELVYRDKPSIFARFARKVMQVQNSDDNAAALQGIRRYVGWLKSIEAPDTFSDIGTNEFSDAGLEHVAKTAWRIYGGNIGKLRKMSCDECLALLKAGRIPLFPQA